MGSRPFDGDGRNTPAYAAWQTEEALKAQRGKPTLDLRYREGLAFLLEKKYTGPFTVHASEGVPKRIVVPNPEGW